MRRASEASNKRDLLERGRGWVETLDWFLRERPAEGELRDALEQARRWSPTELRGKLHKHGRVEALEWLLGR